MLDEFSHSENEDEGYDNTFIEDEYDFFEEEDDPEREAFEAAFANDEISFVYDSSDEVKSERKPPRPPAPRKPSLRNEPIPEPEGKRKDTVFPRNFIKDLIGEYDESKIAHLPEFLKCYEKGGEIKKNLDALFDELNKGSHNAMALRYIHNLSFKQIGERLDQELGVSTERTRQIIQKELRKGRHPVRLKRNNLYNAVIALAQNNTEAAVRTGMYQLSEKTYLNLNDDQYEALGDYMRENAVGKWSFESEPSDYDTIECVVTNNEIDFKTLREYAESENIKAYDTEEACLNDIDREIE